MTFLCGPELEANVPARDQAPYGWPKPWAMRCDTCGAVKDYCVGISQTGADEHTCTECAADARATTRAAERGQFDIFGETHSPEPQALPRDATAVGVQARLFEPQLEGQLDLFG